MKSNQLLNEIIRGTWLLNIHSLETLAPIIQNILAGQLAFPEAREKPLLQLYSEDGYMLASEEEKEEEDKIALVSMIGPVMVLPK
jgi:hypothetical protein